jgi:phospholipase C
MSPITLFEEPSFAGRSLALDIGQRRFFTPDDFNDVASSIQVPAGLVAYLYEHADDFGPFGVAVDLMEDCPDLSVYGMAKAVSYVTVFSSTDPRGFVWARATGSGDTFVAGHWERQRANGQLPPNPGVGAVSPPIPSRTPAPTTVLEIQGATTVITTLVRRTSDRRARGSTR